MAESEVVMLKSLLDRSESEVTRLRRLLIKADKKASLTEHRVSEVTVEAIEAFWKGENFC